MPGCSLHEPAINRSHRRASEDYHDPPYNWTFYLVLSFLSLWIIGHPTQITTIDHCWKVLPHSKTERKRHRPSARLECLGSQLAARILQGIPSLPSLVISWFPQPRPRLDGQFLAGGRNLASQVSKTLTRERESPVWYLPSVPRWPRQNQLNSGLILRAR